MDDALLVRGGERLGQRRGDLEEPLQREPTLRHDPVERLSLDELHGEEVHGPLTGRRRLGVLDGIHRDDAGVIEGGEGPGLLLEARETLGIVRHGGRQHLDRDVASELGVGGPIHLAHAAFAKLLDDAIVAEHTSGHARPPMASAAGRRSGYGDQGRVSARPLASCVGSNVP